MSDIPQSKITQAGLISEIEKLKTRIQELEAPDSAEDDFSFGNIFEELFGADGFDLSSIQEQLLTASLQNIPNPAYMLSMDRKIKGINYHFSNLLNCSLEKAIGRSLINVFPDSISKFVFEKEQELLKNNGTANYEIEFDVEDKNTIVIISESIFNDLSGNPSGIIGVINDITEKRIAERGLIESEKKLREANATKDKFLSIISHDLKSPFTALLGFTDMLINDYDDFTDEERKSFIIEIRNSASNAYDLLDNLLQWSKVVRDKVPYNPSSVSLRQLVNEAVDSFSMELAKKELSVRNLLNENQKTFADCFMISSVIRNIISNSIKFTHNGGVIVVDAKIDNDFLNISILDNGIGMSENDLSLLFRLDVHYKQIGRSNEKGTGLGLILCKEYVTKNNGKIWVESTLGQGTKVTFSLPIYNPDDK